MLGNISVKRWRGVATCLSLFLLLARSSAAEFQPGKCDAVVLEHMRAMVRAVPLRTTTVRDVAPEFAVAKRADLTWDEALADANHRLGESQPTRALFLRKYLSRGAPDSRLLELRWPDSLMSIRSGPNTYGSLVWLGPDPLVTQPPLELSTADGGKITIERWSKSAPTEVAAWIRSNPSVFSPFARRTIARIDIAIADDKLTGVPRLSLPDLEVKGLSFDLLSFDESDRLVSVMQHFTPKSGTPDIRFDGSAGAEGLPDSYQATVSDSDGSSESLDYTPGLVLKARWVQLHG